MSTDGKDGPERTPEAVDRRRLAIGGRWRSAASTILTIVAAAAIALFIAAFIVQSYQVDGQSMETTLQNNDRLIVDKVPRTWARITSHDYVPKRGSIIVFNQSGISATGGEKQLIKRVIGLPGERVVVGGGSITIYNSQNPSGFNPDKLGIYSIAATDTAGEVDLTLGPHEIFVCGDNRSNSEDSRYFGPVNVHNVVGKLVLRILPISHAQKY